MDPLYELVNGLSSKEMNTVKSYLSFFSGSQNADETLIVKLFNFFLSQKLPPSTAEVSSFIYGTAESKEEHVKKLRYRLKLKILDALSSELNDEREDMDEVDYAAFRVKKKSIQARILFFSNPKLEIARELLDEIIAECKKFEFYGVLVEHLEGKRWRYTFKEGEKEYEKNINECNYFKKCANALTEANDYYYKLIFRVEKNNKDDKQLKSFLLKAITALRISSEETKSNMIKYYLKFFEIYYFMMEKNYTKAKKVCSELIDVILSSPAVQRKQRLGIAYDYFSRCELLLRDFDKAVEHTKKAQENFIPSSFNYSLSQEQEYYALFFNKKYAEAERVLMMILGGTSRKEMGELRYAKYNWLHANVLFRQKKFKEALNILKQKWETAKEKESREVEMRLLTLMAHLELGQKEEAKLITESLRKFVQRNKAKTTPRHELILKLLLQAARKDFVFDEKAKPLVVQLASDSKYKWEFLSPELIPFHEWLSERIK